MLDFLAFLGFGYFMKPRFILLLVLLTMVGGATAWRIINPHKRTEISLESLNVRAAPEFQLLDQNNRPAAWLKFSGENEKPVLSPEQLAKTQTDIKAANKLVASLAQ